MWNPVERLYFVLSLGLGRLLRAGRYSKVRLVSENGELHVRKWRSFYAPVLVWLGDPLVRILDTGVFVLPQHDWHEREHLIYRRLHGASIRTDPDGSLILPCLPGKTLAALLEDGELEKSLWRKAVRSAVVALREFHGAGFTHGDAMAENVLVDLDADVAHWFDFETVHDERRPNSWRRADDLRALLATCLLRADRDQRADTLTLILDVYADHEITRLVAGSFASIVQRPLTFHLAQAAFSFQDFHQIARLLRERVSA